MLRNLTAALLLAAAPALADEQPVALKDAPGHETVETNCGACHSVDYIVMNSPFLDAAKWQGEVTKMIKAYGASIGPEDAKAITDYLAANYGG
jgi:sulfite dehydrogenase (cytochrome) subunit B